MDMINLASVLCQGPIRQNAARIAEGADARRVMREREALKAAIATRVQTLVVGAKVLDGAFFDSLAEHVVRIVEGRR